MGFAGIGFLILILGSIAAAAMRLYRNGVNLAQQRMGITLWLAVIGIAINGMTAVVFNSIALGWIFFWLAGAAVTATELSVGLAEERVRTGEIHELTTAT
jgi:hypothetical protein